jgi:acyl carrier protein
MTAKPETLRDLRDLLSRTLQLGDRSADLHESTALLGNLPELDSMAVVQVLAAIEEHFGITVDDDEVSADTFATFGGLADFVESKLVA